MTPQTIENRSRAHAATCRFSIPTRFGALQVEISEAGLRSLQLPDDDEAGPVNGYQRVSPAIQEISYKALKQLSEYFEGRRRIFRLPIDPQGTEFQLRVWDCLSQIPFGQTRSYGEIAEIIGEPDAARAVGQACGANPLPIVVPCHRVLPQTRELGGFSAGVSWKRRLLDIEGFRAA